MEVLFLHSGKETFVNIDQEILGNFAIVNDLYAPLKFPLDILKYWRGIRKSEIVYCWFASWNSFWALLIAKLLGKPSVMVIGGYDVANLPQTDYGHQRGGFQKWISRWSMKMATLLIPFSNYSQQEAENNARIPGARMKVVYLGVPDPIHEIKDTPRSRMALTVGKADWPNLKRKGLEPFVKAAEYLPDLQFVVIGGWADDSIEYLRSIASPNVIFTGRVSDEALHDYYQKASIYVQASMHEGFGLSVAEAMLAGCIPVITRAGSLPEVVGDCGYYCPTCEPYDIAKTIESAQKGPSSLRESARERVLSHFPLEQRKILLEQVCFSVITRGV